MIVVEHQQQRFAQQQVYGQFIKQAVEPFFEPECVKTRQNVVGAQRLLSVVGYLAPKSFWLSYGGPD
ncbi:hypothetical protein JN853_06775 [Pseudomonas syringae pv. actinidiae ICMP 9853]|nr:hypothetical protein JN853_06775 [Pseudomonas syringae pv. actinidiae ICMP 9853]